MRSFLLGLVLVNTLFKDSYSGSLGLKVGMYKARKDISFFEWQNLTNKAEVQRQYLMNKKQFICYLPIFTFLYSIAIPFSKMTLTVHGGDRCTQLAHWMKFTGEIIQELNNMRRQISASSPLFR